MKKRCTEEQVAFALRRADAGTSVEESVWKMGISEVTFYRWRQRYAGLRGIGGASAQATGGGEP